MLYQSGLRNIKHAKARRKFAFTLLEVLVCVGILTLLFGVSIHYGKSAYDAWHYEKTVKRLEQKLDIAFTMAKITQGFVDVVFEKGEKEIFCSLRPSQLVASTLRTLVQKKERLDGAYDLVKNERERVFDGKEKWKLTIYPQGVRPEDAEKITLVPRTSISPKEIDFGTKQLLMKCEEDEKKVLQFFPEELQKEFLAP